MLTRNTLMKMFALGIISFGIISSGTVYAAETTDAKTTMFSRLVEKIAAAFNLDKSKVEVVVEEVQKEHQAERQAEMKQKQAEHLSTLVSEGKITEAQKQAIIAKTEEMRNSFNPETMKNMTQEERKSAMEKQRSNLESWAQSQGIDTQYLMMGRGGKGFMMKGAPADARAQ